MFTRQFLFFHVSCDMSGATVFVAYTIIRTVWSGQMLYRCLVHTFISRNSERCVQRCNVFGEWQNFGKVCPINMFQLGSRTMVTANSLGSWRASKPTIEDCGALPWRNMTEGCSCTIFGATSKSSVCRQKTLPVYLWQNLNNQRTHNRGIGYMYELQIGCQIFTQCFLGRPDEVNSSSLTLPKNISYLRKSFGCSV
jgi:hypothetical protein